MEKETFKVLQNINAHCEEVDKRTTVDHDMLSMLTGRTKKELRGHLIDLEMDRYIDTWQISNEGHEPFFIAIKQKGRDFVLKNNAGKLL